ncbi:MAG: M20/M25/M40 family metallo-hydrolase [Nitrososphaerales archaeon]|nr:M20/M25/M40 family metallo-hydrolase [Nitrososphaerales archaeon]
MAIDPVALLMGALRIYSPTGEEGRLASYIRARMKEFGYSKVRVDRAGNVIGEVGRGPISLLLCGHMDTIPGRLDVKSEVGFVHGRGAVDAKSPLCALLIAGARARDAGVKMTFAAATDEEGDGFGIQTLTRSGTKYKFAIFGEPSGADRVTIGYRGRVSMRVVLKTGGGHAGSSWAHVSALDEFYSIVNALKELERGSAVGASHFRSLSVSPTLMKAGTYHNVVPPTCEATFDIRIPPGMKSSRGMEMVEGVVRKSVHGSTSVEVQFDEATEPYEADPNSILTRAFQRSIILKLKAKPVMVRKTGTGDMNTLASATDAQCVTYGPGDSEYSHTDKEKVSVRDYLDSIGVLEEAIRQVATLSAKT